MIDERKKIILKAIIDDYISSAEPVGSRTVARKHELGLSSATIRNEMSDLEELGYLSQPHTSSGRIPSDKGYRFYVNELMNISKLTLDDIQSVKSALEVSINELNDLIKQASAVMSKITNYTSMVSTPEMKQNIVKAVQVVPIEMGRALVVVVVNGGIVRNTIVKIPEDILPDYLIKISNLLNSQLCGLPVSKIKTLLMVEFKDIFNIPENLLMTVLKGVEDCVGQMDISEVYMDGITNIFNFPEFKDIHKAKEFLNILDTKELIFKLLDKVNDKREISVCIGQENIFEEIKEYSLITTTYSLNDIVIGSIGVIGPTRMNYSRVITSMNYVRKKINEEIFKLL